MTIREKPRLNPDETIDGLLHGELKLIQPRSGFRYSVDALLLAAFALPLARGAAVLDMGAGAGTVALILAARGRAAAVTAVEIQETLADMALRNAAMNETTPRVEVIRADAMDPSALPNRKFDLIVSNPPFRSADSGHLSPNREKAVARHEVAMDLGGWLKSASALLAADGHACIVYPVNEEKRLFAAAEKNGLHPRREQYAIDRPGGERKLVLVDFSLSAAAVEKLDDVPIQINTGKFSLDGWR